MQKASDFRNSLPWWIRPVLDVVWEALLAAVLLVIAILLFSDWGTAWRFFISNASPVLFALLIMLGLLLSGNYVYQLSMMYYQTKKTFYLWGFITLVILLLAGAGRTIGREFYMPSYFPTETPTLAPTSTPEILIQTRVVKQTVVVTATYTHTPPEPPSQAEEYHEAIRAVIVQLLMDWNNEIFPDTWDTHVTDNYLAEYAGHDFDKVGLQNLFGKSNREIVGEIIPEWIFDGDSEVVGAKATLEFSYGDDSPILTCPNYWFKLVRDRVAGSWLVADDKTLAAEDQMIVICPEGDD